MFKRYFMFLLIAAFMLICPLTAYADVLITPRNDFYEQHHRECEYEGRSYYVNGPGGSVSVREEPGSKKEVSTIKNGEKILIQFIYGKNGQAWGAMISGNPEKPDGWIPMEQLALAYDYIYFDEEHQDEYYTYNGDYAELYAAKDIVLWTWPGSGEVAFSLKEDQRSIDAEKNFLDAPSHAYKDSAGREWVFISYFYGARNTWACLSDPASTDIPAFNPPPQPELWPPGDLPSTPGWLPLPVLIIILVAAVAVVTAVLIRVFWKPKVK